MTPDQGIPGWFIAVFVLVAVLSIGTGIWRVIAARKMAQAAGLDPTTAGAVTLLSNDGLGAAYLASALRPTSGPQPSGAISAPKTVEQRLDELRALRTKNVITQDEYDSRRREILGSI